MKNEQFAKASVLLYDQRNNVRRQTRSVLNSLGFWSIEEVDDVGRASHELRTGRFNLAILSCQDQDDKALSLVRAVRRRKCGPDPFIPVILTTWNSLPQLVSGVSNSGADDLLVHPFSTAKLGERISMILKHRKPFVITEDYLGPDRRRVADRAGDAATVSVPNALKAVIEDRKELMPNADLVKLKLAELERLKVRNIARKIWAISDNLRKGYGQPGHAERLEVELACILESAAIYRKSLARCDVANLAPLCDSVVRVAISQREQTPSEYNLEILEQAAQALRVASEIDQDTKGAVDHISDAMTKMPHKDGAEKPPHVAAS